MAHGLVLRMKDRLELENKRNENLQDKKNSFGGKDVSDDVSIIKSWINAINHPQNSKIEYFILLRKTLLFMLSPKWTRSANKEDVLYAFTHHYKKFSTITSHCVEVYNAVIKISNEPWRNSFVSWEDLFREKKTIDDKDVQNYFASEPEEIILARVHSLVDNKNTESAMCLAKLSFLYHQRAAGNPSTVGSRRGSVEGANKRGQASIDWFATLLKKTKSLSQIAYEMQKLKCHEGIEIICRLRKDTRNIKFSYALLQILLIQDLLKSSEYCCTKKLFTLFCLMHKELNSSPREITESALKIFANYAPSSAHLYLFVDVVWKLFGTKCLNLYVDLYVRGLTADINHLEDKKNSNVSADVIFMETHLSTIYAKLSSLFSDCHEEASRECMFSSFSLRPTKEKLHQLQRLTHNLSIINKNTGHFSSHDSVAKTCSCSLRCVGPCKNSFIGSSFLHPLLNKGIRTVTYSLIKDFVSILESTRCIKFQYNLFDWQRHAADLVDYVRAFNHEKNTLKDWGSDTEVASNASSRSDPEDYDSSPENKQVVPTQSLAKRKSIDTGGALNVDVAANIEVKSNDSASKRLKLQKPDVLSKTKLLEANRHYPPTNLDSTIETFIRATLTNNIAQGQSAVYKLPVKSLNLSKEENRSMSFAESKRQLHVNHNTVHPFTLTNHGSLENLSSPPKYSHESSASRIHSSIASQNSFMTNKGHPSTTGLSQDLTRHSVVVRPENKGVHYVDHNEGKKSYSSARSLGDNYNPPVQMSIGKHFTKISTADVPQHYRVVSTPKDDALNLSCNSGYENTRHVQEFHKRNSQTDSRSHTKPVQNNPFIAFTPASTKPLVEDTVSSTVSNTQGQVNSDRSSVIQHTTQHATERIPISLNSTTIQQLRNFSPNDGIPFYGVNISNKNMSKVNVAVSSSSMVPHRSSQSAATYSSAEAVKNSNPKTIKIPIILPPPSALAKAPLWDSSSKDLDKVHYAKITSTTTTVKKIYYKPYTKQLPQVSSMQSQSIKNAISYATSSESKLKILNTQQAQPLKHAVSYTLPPGTSVQKSITNQGQSSRNSVPYTTAPQSKVQMQTSQHGQPSKSAVANATSSRSKVLIQTSQHEQPLKNTVSSSHKTNVQACSIPQSINNDLSTQWPVTSGALNYSNQQSKMSHLNSQEISRNPAKSVQQWVNNTLDTSISHKWENSHVLGSDSRQLSINKVASSNKLCTPSAVSDVRHTPSMHQSISNRNSPSTSHSQPWYSTPFPKSPTSSNSNNRHSSESNRQAYSPDSFSAKEVAQFTTSSQSLLKSRLTTAQGLPPDAHYSTSSPNEKINISEDMSRVSPSNLVRNDFLEKLSNPSISVSTSCNSQFSREVSVQGFPPNAHTSMPSSNAGNEHHASSYIVRKDFSEESPNLLLPSSNTHSSQFSCELSAVQTCNQYDIKSTHSVVSKKDISSVAFQAINNALPSQYSHTESGLIKTCCSPLEVEPCQNCSTAKRGGQPERSNAMGSEQRNISNQVPSCDSIVNFEQAENFPKTIYKPSVTNDSVLQCQFCSLSYPKSLMKIHKETSHSKELNQIRRNLNVNEKAPSVYSDPLRDVDCLISDKKDAVVSSAEEQSFLNSCFNLMHGGSSSSSFSVNPPNQVETSQEGTSYPISVPQGPDINDLERNTFGNSAAFEDSNFSYQNEQEISWSRDPFCKEQKACTDKLLNNPADNDDLSWMEISRNENQLESETGFRTPNPHSHLFADTDIFLCGLCKMKFATEGGFKKHFIKCHIKYGVNELNTSTEKNPLLSSMLDMFHVKNTDSHEQAPSNDLKCKSASLVCRDENIEMKNSMNQQTPKSVEQRFHQVMSKEAKGKKIPKGTTRPCKYCGKILTVLYMRTHLLKVHPEMLEKTNGSSPNQNSSQTAEPFAVEDSLLSTAVSALLSDDIDTRTCLTPSDTRCLNNVPQKKMHGGSNAKTARNDTTMTMPRGLDESVKSKLKKCLKKPSPLTLTADASAENSSRNDFTCATDSENYSCRLCFRNYTSKAYIYKHIKTYHHLSDVSEAHYDYQADSDVCLPSTSKTGLESTAEIKQESSKMKEPKREFDLSGADANKVSQSVNKNIPDLKNNRSNGTDSTLNSYDQKEVTVDKNLYNALNQPSKFEIKNENLHLMEETSDTNISVKKNKKSALKLFSCPLCNKAFCYKGYLSRHLKEHHQDTTDKNNRCKPSSGSISSTMNKIAEKGDNESRTNEAYSDRHPGFSLSTEYTSTPCFDEENGLLTRADFKHSSISKEVTTEKKNGKLENVFAYPNSNNASEDMHALSPISNIANFSSYSMENEIDDNFNSKNATNEPLLFGETSLSTSIPVKKMRTSTKISESFSSSSFQSTVEQSESKPANNIMEAASSMPTDNLKCPICFKILTTFKRFTNHIAKKKHNKGCKVKNFKKVGLGNKVTRKKDLVKTKYPLATPKRLFSNLGLNSQVSDKTYSSHLEKKLVFENKFAEDSQSFHPSTNVNANTIQIPSANDVQIKSNQEPFNYTQKFSGGFEQINTFPNIQLDNQNKQDPSPVIAYNLPMMPVNNNAMANIDPSLILPSSSQVQSIVRDTVQVNNTCKMDPAILTAEDSTVIKHALMFSDLLDDFEKDVNLNPAFTSEIGISEQFIENNNCNEKYNFFTEKDRNKTFAAIPSVEHFEKLSAPNLINNYLNESEPAAGECYQPVNQQNSSNGLSTISDVLAPSFPNSFFMNERTLDKNLQSCTEKNLPSPTMQNINNETNPSYFSSSLNYQQPFIKNAIDDSPKNAEFTKESLVQFENQGNVMPSNNLENSELETCNLSKVNNAGHLFANENNEDPLLLNAALEDTASMLLNKCKSLSTADGISPSLTFNQPDTFPIYVSDDNLLHNCDTLEKGLVTTEINADYKSLTPDGGRECSVCFKRNCLKLYHCGLEEVVMNNSLDIQTKEPQNKNFSTHTVYTSSLSNAPTLIEQNNLQLEKTEIKNYSSKESTALSHSNTDSIDANNSDDLNKMVESFMKENESPQDFNFNDLGISLDKSTEVKNLPIKEVEKTKSEINENDVEENSYSADINLLQGSHSIEYQFCKTMHSSDEIENQLADTSHSNGASFESSIADLSSSLLTPASGQDIMSVTSLTNETLRDSDNLELIPTPKYISADLLNEVPDVLNDDSLKSSTSLSLENCLDESNNLMEDLLLSSPKKDDTSSRDLLEEGSQINSSTVDNTVSEASNVLYAENLRSYFLSSKKPGDSSICRTEEIPESTSIVIKLPKEDKSVEVGVPCNLEVCLSERDSLNESGDLDSYCASTSSTPLKNLDVSMSQNICTTQNGNQISQKKQIMTNSEATGYTGSESKSKKTCLSSVSKKKSCEPPEDADSSSSDSISELLSSSCTNDFWNDDEAESNGNSAIPLPMNDDISYSVCITKRNLKIKTEPVDYDDNELQHIISVQKESVSSPLPRAYNNNFLLLDNYNNNHSMPFKAASPNLKYFKNCSRKLSRTCRFCNKVFRTTTFLSRHLKSMHQVPPLKNLSSLLQIRPVTVNIERLSPPDLSVDSHYDSDSVPVSAGSLSNLSEGVTSASEPLDPSACETSSIDDDAKSINQKVLRSHAQTALDADELSIISVKLNNSKTWRNSEISSDSDSCEIIYIGCTNKNLIRHRNRTRKGYKIKTCAVTKTVKQKRKTRPKHEKQLSKKETPLQKCIIKICKDEKNSLFYQIDNSQLDSLQAPQLKSLQLNPSSTLQTKCTKSTIKKRMKKSIKNQSLSFRQREKGRQIRKAAFLCRMSHFKNATLKSKSFKIKSKVKKLSHKLLKTKKMLAKTIKKHTSSLGSSAIENSSGPDRIMQSFKGSEAIEGFLREHSQPILCLKRVKSNLIGSMDINSDFTLSSSNEIPLKQPIVRLERLDFEFNVKRKINHTNLKLKTPVPNSLQNRNNVICEVKDNNLDLCEKSSVIKSADSTLLDDISSLNVSMQEEIQVLISPPNLCDMMQGNHSTSNFDSDCLSKTDKHIVPLQLIKECSVLLNKLPRES